MREFLWRFVARVFQKQLDAACAGSYEAGYEHGYHEAHVPEGAFREEFEKGYAAARYDGCDCDDRR